MKEILVVRVKEEIVDSYIYDSSKDHKDVLDSFTRWSNYSFDAFDNIYYVFESCDFLEVGNFESKKMMVEDLDNETEIIKKFTEGLDNLQKTMINLI